MKNKLIDKRANNAVVQQFLRRVAEDRKASFTPKKQRETSPPLFNNRLSDSNNNSDKNIAQK